MNSFPTLAISLLIPLFFAYQPNTVQESIWQNPRIFVKITNALQANNQLTLHCKSGDDDLGVHKLALSDSYEFSFRPNLWQSTLFYCSFQWPGTFHYFDIYIDKRDRNNCVNTLCSWYVREQNICLFNYKTKNYQICYEWSRK